MLSNLKISSSNSETKKNYRMISFISSQLVKMAVDSSKIYHCAPPLLRAFNLSKQPFSLPHNSQDAIFSHRSSFMLARSPFFPSLSFLPKNQPLPSMASPVAGITSDEWHDHHISLRRMAQPVSAGSFSFNCEYSLNSSTVTAVAEEPADAEEPCDSSDACEEFKLLAKEIMEAEPATSLLPSPELSPIPSPTPDTAGRNLHGRGRQELEDFILKLEEERRRERLPRLQSATLFPNSVCVALFRKRHEDGSQGEINEVPTEESIIGMEVQLSNSLVYVLAITIDHFDIENDRLVGLISTRKIEYSPEAFNSLQAFYTSSSQYEDQLDCQKPLDSHMFQTLLDEISSEGTEMANEEQNVVSGGDGNWLLQPCNSWRGWWRK